LLSFKFNLCRYYMALMPRTNFLSLTPKACVTTCTDDGELQCEPLGGGAVLAVGGCQGKVRQEQVECS
jgi:hypothetical protein